MNRLQQLGRYSISWQPPRVMDGNRQLKLTSRQFKVLSVLVRARGRVVSKQAFHEKVWAGQIVEEGNLTQTIFLLRRVLGKLPDGAPYIETVAREGYRIPAAAFKTAHSQKVAPLDTTAEASLQELLPFRLLVESIEDYSIYMLDCAGRILTWNRGAAHNKGYTREEVLGKHYSLFFVPEDIEANIPDRELATAARLGKCEGKGWRIRKDGERFWASYLITAIRGSDKKLVGYAKVVRDLTETKRQEDMLLRNDAAIRRERDRLHAAAESSMDALFICEAVRSAENEVEDFVFTYLNRNVEAMVSVPHDVLLGGRMLELLPVNRSLGLFEACKRVLHTGEKFVEELPIRAGDIRPEWVRVQAVRLGDGVAITASDISDRVRTEQQLRHLLATCHCERDANLP